MSMLNFSWKRKVLFGQVKMLLLCLSIRMKRFLSGMLKLSLKIKMPRGFSGFMDQIASIFISSLWCCSYVSETTRQFAVPSLAQRHILAGLASAVGGLSAPYERASHIHERPIVNWLWAAGCHPFGPFSNTSQISQILQDVALVIMLLTIS
jgi:hypothetical protein